MEEDRLNCPFNLEGLDQQEVINTDEQQDLYNIFCRVTFNVCYLCYAIMNLIGYSY